MAALAGNLSPIISRDTDDEGNDALATDTGYHDAMEGLPPLEKPQPESVKFRWGNPDTWTTPQRLRTALLLSLILLSAFVSGVLVMDAVVENRYPEYDELKYSLKNTCVLSSPNQSKESVHADMTFLG